MPTNAILGWADMISARCADEEVVAHGIEAIRRNARLQAELIKQLMDFARVKTDRLNLEWRTVALAPALEAAVETIRPLARSKAIQTQTELDGAGVSVAGGPTRLHQVFTNLLSNAIKFTPEGGGVCVRLARCGDSAEVTVSDTGRGIRPDFLPYVFEPFRREEEGIARGHGGEIRAESDGEGRGATFTVLLRSQCLEEDVLSRGFES